MTKPSTKKTPRILLFGANGQVGWELQRSLAPLGQLLALGRDAASNPNGWCGDLSELQGLANTIATFEPSIIVNAAAYTAVDLAESDPQGAARINAQAPAVMAEQAHKLGALLVHYSTDYVYDGSGTKPWQEDAPTAPLSVYGETKLLGDQAIQALCASHLIFRTSWVYGARGGNFAKTMIKLASEKSELKVVGDQVGAPTGADLIADVSAHAIHAWSRGPARSGVYHLAAAGATSWCGYARYVLQLAMQRGFALKVSADQVQEIATADFPRPAQRPLNSRLDVTSLETTFDLVMPPWEKGARRLVAMLEPNVQS